MRRTGGTRHRARRTPAQWRELVEGFERSGQTRGKFCAANGLALSTFDLWRCKLRATPAAVEEGLLRELIDTTMREGGNLPEPSRAGRGRPLVVPPVQIALKAALYEAWRQAGISQRRLARDLDVAESEVRRMLNPEHSTKAATIDRALRRLGKHVTVTVGEAA